MLLRQGTFSFGVLSDCVLGYTGVHKIDVISSNDIPDVLLFGVVLGYHTVCCLPRMIPEWSPSLLMLSIGCLGNPNFLLL